MIHRYTIFYKYEDSIQITVDVHNGKKITYTGRDYIRRWMTSRDNYSYALLEKKKRLNPTSKHQSCLFRGNDCSL